jgi:coenzyme F420 hydrogenase subunit delta
MLTKRVVVYGCGNTLKGDDGAGPAVVELLEKENLPDSVGMLDIGTSIKQVLFDMRLLEPKPERIIIVDATTQEGHKPGESWEIDVDELIPQKVKDYSFHLFPSLNLLKLIRDETQVEIKILVVQTGYVPDEIDDHIGPEVTAALPGMCARVKELCLEVANRPPRS